MSLGRCGSFAVAVVCLWGGEGGCFVLLLLLCVWELFVCFGGSPFSSVERCQVLLFCQLLLWVGDFRVSPQVMMTFLRMSPKLHYVCLSQQIFSLCLFQSTDISMLQ